jgi:hypothetical protein
MTSEYWVIRRDDGVWYYFDCPHEDDGGQSPVFSLARQDAERFATLEDAKSAIRSVRSHGHRVRLVHVRIRPRAERLHLAARLAAWEPVVRAAVQWAVDYECNGTPPTIWRAVQQMPEEHRPEVQELADARIVVADGKVEVQA